MSVGDDFLIYKNVIFLKNDHIDKVPAILERIESISPDCGSVYNKCGVYDTCVSYTVMKFKKTAGITPETLNEHADELMGYLVAVVDHNRELTEIYDVCVAKKSRKQGAARELLEAITVKTIYPRMWLGIMLDNPNWDSVIKLYARAGFRHPLIYEKTPFGWDIGTSVVGLIYYDPSVKGVELIPSDPNIVIRDATELRERYLRETEKCTTNIVMSSQLALYLYTYLDKDREYGGEIVISEYKDNHAILAVNTEKIYEGESPPNFVVNVPYNNITFHTHPRLCYIEHQCYIGWPSGMDMGYVVMGYVAEQNPLFIHFVVTAEGIYSVRLTTDFQNILRKLGNDCISYIVQRLVQRFTEIEQERKAENDPEVLDVLIESNDSSLLFYETEKKAWLKQRYMEFTKHYSFRNLVEDTMTKYPVTETELGSCARITNKDFKLFIVELASWEFMLLDEHGDPRDHVVGQFIHVGECPIEVTSLAPDKIIQ